MADHSPTKTALSGLAFVLVPLSVYTLGLANLVLNALLTWLVLDELPGVRLDGFGTALLVTLVTTTVTTLLSSALALDDDSWFDQRMAHRKRRLRGATVSDVPGVVFVQIDGLSEPALAVALASGDAPTLHRWLADDSHRTVGWQTEWSSQTGVSQCGILHGSTSDMPAFRWIDKQSGELVVSNHPKSALAIETEHGDGNGLLAHNGSSYGNLFTGDAQRAVLTMSVAGRRKEGRLGAGYGRYFIHEPLEGCEPKHIFLSQGWTDNYTPPVLTEALAVATGLELVWPWLEPLPRLVLGGQSDALSRPVSGNLNGGSITGVLLQYLAWGSADGHYVVDDNPNANLDYRHFLGTAMRNTRFVLVAWPVLDAF